MLLFTRHVCLYIPDFLFNQKEKEDWICFWAKHWKANENTPTPALTWLTSQQLLRYCGNSWVWKSEKHEWREPVQLESGLTSHFCFRVKIGLIHIARPCGATFRYVMRLTIDFCPSPLESRIRNVDAVKLGVLMSVEIRHIHRHAEKRVQNYMATTERKIKKRHGSEKLQKIHKHKWP